MQEEKEPIFFNSIFLKLHGGYNAKQSNFQDSFIHPLTLYNFRFYYKASIQKNCSSLFLINGMNKNFLKILLFYKCLRTRGESFDIGWMKLFKGMHKDQNKIKGFKVAS